MLNVFSLVPRPPLFYLLLHFQSEEYVFLGPGTLCKLRGCAIVSEHQSNLVIILRGIMKLMYQSKFLNMQTMVVMTWNTKGRHMNITLLTDQVITWCLVKITAAYTHTRGASHWAFRKQLSLLWLHVTMWKWWSTCSAGNEFMQVVS